jgi:hypothetical protein
MPNNVRTSAAQFFAAYRPELSNLTRLLNCLPVCLFVCLRDSDWRVRAAAVGALGRGQKSIASLLKPLIFDSESGVRIAAVQALLHWAEDDWLQEQYGHIHAVGLLTDATKFISVSGDGKDDLPLALIRVYPRHYGKHELRCISVRCSCIRGVSFGMYTTDSAR